MNRKMIVALFLAAALVPFAPSGVASHTGMYSRTPVEHDDQGRSIEPDFANTAVFGPLVVNKVIDANNDGVATADGALGVAPGAKLAPGCTDDTGRRPSGACGLWTIGAGTPAGATVTVVPPGVAGVQGMGGNAAPGAFTPTKATKVRFLDTIWHFQQNSAGSTYIELNRKVDDSGLRPVLASIDSNLAGDFILGPNAVWAWYGQWQDKNGNGVIDSLYDAPALTFPPAPAGDEFIWYGNCRQFPDAPAPGSIGKFCNLDTEAATGGQTRMLGFMFPGNHHSFCGGFVDPLFLSCGNFPADIPGRQVIHFVGAVGAGPPCAGAVGAFCAGGDLRGFDNFDETTLGDPLLGPQNSVAFDQEFNDRTGEPRRDVRQWVYGLGWTTYFYDQSIANSLVSVTAVGCAADQTSPNKVQLGTCRSTDVDSFRTFSPTVESALSGLIKPAARSNWVFVRDSYIPMATTMDGLQNGKASDLTPVTGPLDDRAQNPGYGREPNDALDSFPAASRNAACADSKARFQGWCNNYNAHKTAPNAFGDLIPVRALIINRPVGAGGGCVLCVAGTFLTTGYQGEAPAGSPAPVLRAEGDYRNTLGPGQYIWAASFGQWQDKSQVWEESFLNLATQSTVTNTYTRAADGWVGNIVNATGTWYYRGYTDEACTTDQGAGMKTYGTCHPYLDGAISTPQQMGAGTPLHGEWSGRCDGINGGGIVLTPVDGVWSVPVIVFRNHQNGIDALALESSLISKVQDLTGTSGPIVLNAACSSGSSPGLLAVADLLILPAGNAGETLRSSITVKVGTQTVTDVDTYYG
jgi:hypothetical protein